MAEATSMNAMPMGGDVAHAWVAAPAAFIGMWLVTMVPMMLPVLVPMLCRYRRAARGSDARRAFATAVVAVGYVFVWTVFGAAVYPLSVALTRLATIASGVIVAIAGAWQLTTWKAHHLACCRRAALGRSTPRADADAAWRHGTRLGLECVRCCCNLMVIPLVFGVMDLRAMALVGAAITLERLAPAGERVARAAGVAAVLAGLLLIARGSA
jgi:predicted metal-binding membrane protein